VRIATTGELGIIMEILRDIPDDPDYVVSYGNNYRFCYKRHKCQIIARGKADD